MQPATVVLSRTPHQEMVTDENLSTTVQMAPSAIRREAVGPVTGGNETTVLGGRAESCRYMLDGTSEDEDRDISALRLAELT